jgi:hypothetical protein
MYRKILHELKYRRKMPIDMLAWNLATSRSNLIELLHRLAAFQVVKIDGSDVMITSPEVVPSIEQIDHILARKFEKS